MNGEPPVRYVLHPGYVLSATDGQRYFISGKRLAALYGLDSRDWQGVVCASDRGYRELPSDVHLYPRRDGDYTLPHAAPQGWALPVSSGAHPTPAAMTEYDGSFHLAMYEAGREFARRVRQHEKDMLFNLLSSGAHPTPAAPPAGPAGPMSLSGSATEQ